MPVFKLSRGCFFGRVLTAYCSLKWSWQKCFLTKSFFAKFRSSKWVYHFSQLSHLFWLQMKGFQLPQMTKWAFRCEVLPYCQHLLGYFFQGGTILGKLFYCLWLDIIWREIFQAIFIHLQVKHLRLLIPTYSGRLAFWNIVKANSRIIQEIFHEKNIHT